MRRFGSGRSSQRGDAEGAHWGVFQDVDPAELCGGVLQCLGEGVAIEYVRGECGGGDALGGEGADEIVELGAVAGDQGDVVALGAEGTGDGQTQLRAAPTMAMLVTAILS